MDTEERGLRERIAARPDEDRLRREYARWLNERGDPHGRFVDASCRLHGIAANPTLWEMGYAEVRVLLAEIAETVEHARRRFFERIDQLGGVEPMFVRGMVEGL